MPIGDWWDGLLDEIAVFDKALTQEEIELVMHGLSVLFYQKIEQQAEGAADGSPLCVALNKAPKQKGNLDFEVAFLVPEVGIEPTWGCPQRILSPSRLPVPPLRRGTRLTPL